MRKKIGDLVKNYEKKLKEEIPTGKTVEQIDEEILEKNKMINDRLNKVYFEQKKKEMKERMAKLDQITFQQIRQKVVGKLNLDMSVNEDPNNVRKRKKKIEKQFIAIEKPIEKISKQEDEPNPVIENSNQLDVIISQLSREFDLMYNEGSTINEKNQLYNYNNCPMCKKNERDVTDLCSLFQCHDITKCNCLLNSDKKDYRELEQNNKKEVRFQIVDNYLDHKENQIIASPIMNSNKIVKKRESSIRHSPESIIESPSKYLKFNPPNEVKSFAYTPHSIR